MFTGSIHSFTEREKGAVVPPEQVTYLHYLSSHQRRLQHLLEEEARANRLAQFVTEADRFCYLDAVRKFSIRKVFIISPFSAVEGSVGLQELPPAFTKGPVSVPVLDQL